MSKALAIYGSHDSSICILPETDQYRVYELERLTGERNYSLANDPNFRYNLMKIKHIIEKDYGPIKFGSCFYGQISKERLRVLTEIFGFDYFEEMGHHNAHAAGAIYQCNYDRCLVISSDSGGHEVEDGVQTFCIFLADKTQPMNHVIKKLANIPLDACGAYTLIAVPISEIKKTDTHTKYLTYAGKIMGLAAYGKIIKEWISPMKKFYYGPINLETLKMLGDEIGIDMTGINTVSGQVSYDIAATSQYVFEELTLGVIMPFIERYKLPVVLTGGGALNVLFNQRLRDLIHYPVFVPCNPNDCGLSFGMMTLRNPPTLNKINIAYGGFGILDIDELQGYVKEYNAKRVTPKQVAEIIESGKIVGVMRGNSECGPRALGNRSILCDPGNPNMKEILNERVKFREWFRPFAPIVRDHDVHEYFRFMGSAPFMTFAPLVRSNCKDKVPAIVHVDGTSRIQTVSRDDNFFIYSVISELNDRWDMPMVLNTSLNTKGKPIATTIAEALEILKTTGLDCMVIEDYLFEKK